MATLKELADSERIQRISVPLRAGRQPWRRLYGSLEFTNWVANVLPALSTGSINSRLTPNEQVYALFQEFISGEPLVEDRRFRALARTPDLFVWELKTDDIRIFGWFVEMDCFFACYGDEKDEIERVDSYGRYMAQVDFFRRQLELNDPKSIEFKEYANVLSNADR